MALSVAVSRAFADGNPVEGNRLLAQLLDRQALDLPEDDGRRGNFRWNESDSAPIDLNALSFCGPHLGYVFMEHGDRLSADNARRMREVTLPECLWGYDHHYRDKSSGVVHGGPQPRWWQTNIWFLNLAGRVMIARALDRRDHIAIARDHLNQACRYVQFYNNGEYNSPTYTPHQIYALHWAWYYAPDEVFRTQARRLLDKLYLDLAEHYHAPSETLGGTWSRHYEKNITNREGYGALVAAAFEKSAPSLLESLGLTDYQCPPELCDIALHKTDYYVWRKNLGRISRTTYHTPDYSLATQTGAFLWPQQDTWVSLTYVTESSQQRRLALIRTPYWSRDPGGASYYSLPFRRYAHQHENRAILSFGHGDYFDEWTRRRVPAGNDVLFSLAHVAEFTPRLVDAAGRPIAAPTCPMMPVPPCPPDVTPVNNVHFNRPSPFACADPADREPPGAAVNGPIIAELPSCYLAVIPEEGLSLRAAQMEDEVYLVIPVRPTALAALYVRGKSQCPSLADFVTECADLALAKTALPNTGVGVSLSGRGPRLTAAYVPDGRLYDCRVDEEELEYADYVCYSPFHKRRGCEPLEVRSGDDADDKCRAALCT